MRLLRPALRSLRHLRSPLVHDEFKTLSQNLKIKIIKMGLERRRGESICFHQAQLQESPLPLAR